MDSSKPTKMITNFVKENFTKAHHSLFLSIIWDWHEFVLILFTDSVD